MVVKRTALGAVVMTVLAIACKRTHDLVPILTLPLQTLLVCIAAGATFGRWMRMPFEIPLAAGMILLGVQFDRGVLASVGWRGAAAVFLHWSVVAVVFATWMRGRGRGLVAVALSGCGISAAAAAHSGARETARDGVSLAIALTLATGALGFAALPAAARWLELDGPELALWAGIVMPTSTEAVLIGAAHSPHTLQLTAAYRFLVNLLQWIPVVLYVVVTTRRRPSTERTSLTSTALRAIPGFVWGLAAFALCGACGWFAPGERHDLGHITNWCLLTALAGIGFETRIGQLRTLGWRAVGRGICCWAIGAGVTLAIWT